MARLPIVSLLHTCFYISISVAFVHGLAAYFV